MQNKPFIRFIRPDLELVHLGAAHENHIVGPEHIFMALHQADSASGNKIKNFRHFVRVRGVIFRIRDLIQRMVAEDILVAVIENSFHAVFPL